MAKNKYSETSTRKEYDVESGKVIEVETSGVAWGGIAEDMLTDMVVRKALPSKGGNQAKRDAEDAGNADLAFTVILSTAVGVLLAPAAGTTIASAGGATPATATYSAIVTAAATATRIAWQKLAAQDKAKIWRGGV